MGYQYLGGGTDMTTGMFTAAVETASMLTEIFRT